MKKNYKKFTAILLLLFSITIGISAQSTGYCVYEIGDNLNEKAYLTVETRLSDGAIILSITGFSFGMEGDGAWFRNGGLEGDIPGWTKNLSADLKKMTLIPMGALLNSGDSFNVANVLAWTTIYNGGEVGPYRYNFFQNRPYIYGVGCDAPVIIPEKENVIIRSVGSAAGTGVGMVEISGPNLIGNVTITPSAGFEVSVNTVAVPATITVTPAAATQAPVFGYLELASAGAPPVFILVAYLNADAGACGIEMYGNNSPDLMAYMDIETATDKTIVMTLKPLDSDSNVRFGNLAWLYVRRSGTGENITGSFTASISGNKAYFAPNQANVFLTGNEIEFYNAFKYYVNDIEYTYEVPYYDRPAPVFPFTYGTVCPEQLFPPALTIEEEPEPITSILGSTSFTFNGAYLEEDVEITLNSPDFNIVGATVVPHQNGQVKSAEVQVSLLATVTGNYAATVTLTSGDATLEVPVSASVTSLPVLTVGTATPAVINYENGTSTFTFSGQYLSGPVTLQAPVGFTVSPTSVNPVNGTVSDVATVVAAVGVGVSASGTVSVTTPYASATEYVSVSASIQTPVITADAVTSSLVITLWEQNATFTFSGQYLSAPVILTAPDGFTVRPESVTPVNGEIVSAVASVYCIAAPNATVTGDVTLSSQNAVSQTVSVQGEMPNMLFSNICGVSVQGLVAPAGGEALLTMIYDKASNTVRLRLASTDAFPIGFIQVEELNQDYFAQQHVYVGSSNQDKLVFELILALKEGVVLSEEITDHLFTFLRWSKTNTATVWHTNYTTILGLIADDGFTPGRCSVLNLPEIGEVSPVFVGSNSVVLDVSNTVEYAHPIVVFDVFLKDGDNYILVASNLEAVDDKIIVDGLVPEKTVNLVVVAKDVEGNESDYSNVVTVTTREKIQSEFCNYTIYANDGTTEMAKLKMETNARGEITATLISLDENVDVRWRQGSGYGIGGYPSGFSVSGINTSTLTYTPINASSPNVGATLNFSGYFEYRTFTKAGVQLNDYWPQYNIAYVYGSTCYSAEREASNVCGVEIVNPDIYQYGPQQVWRDGSATYSVYYGSDDKVHVRMTSTTLNSPGGYTHIDYMQILGLNPEYFAETNVIVGNNASDQRVFEAVLSPIKQLPETLPYLFRELRWGKFNTAIIWYDALATERLENYVPGYCPDLAPVWKGEPVASNTTSVSTRIDVSSADAFYNYPIESYKVYAIIGADTVLLQGGLTPVGGYIMPQLQEETSYSLLVTIVDSNGNESAYSNVIEVETSQGLRSDICLDVIHNAKDESQADSRAYLAVTTDLVTNEIVLTLYPNSPEQMVSFHNNAGAVLINRKGQAGNFAGGEGRFAIDSPEFRYVLPAGVNYGDTLSINTVGWMIDLGNNNLNPYSFNNEIADDYLTYVYGSTCKIREVGEEELVWGNLISLCDVSPSAGAAYLYVEDMAYSGATVLNYDVRYQAAEAGNVLPENWITQYDVYANDYGYINLTTLEKATTYQVEARVRDRDLNLSDWNRVQVVTDNRQSSEFCNTIVSHENAGLNRIYVTIETLETGELELSMSPYNSTSIGAWRNNAIELDPGALRVLKVNGNTIVGAVVNCVYNDLRTVAKISFSTLEGPLVLNPGDVIEFPTLVWELDGAAYWAFNAYTYTYGTDCLSPISILPETSPENRAYIGAFPVGTRSRPIPIQGDPENINATFSIHTDHINGKVTLESTSGIFEVSTAPNPNYAIVPKGEAVYDPEDNEKDSGIFYVVFEASPDDYTNDTIVGEIVLHAGCITEIIYVKAVIKEQNAPRWETMPTVVEVNGTSVVFDVSGAKDDVEGLDKNKGIQSFNVYAVIDEQDVLIAENVPYDEAGKRAVMPSGLIEEGKEYEFRLEIVDKDGNKSSLSDNVEAETGADALACEEVWTLTNGETTIEFLNVVMTRLQPDGLYTVEVRLENVVCVNGETKVPNPLNEVIMYSTEPLLDGPVNVFSVTDNRVKAAVANVASGVYPINEYAINGTECSIPRTAFGEQVADTFSTAGCVTFSVFNIPEIRLVDATGYMVIEGVNLKRVIEVKIDGVTCPVDREASTDSRLVVAYTPERVGAFKVECIREEIPGRIDKQEGTLVIHNDPAPIIFNVEPMNIGDFYFYIDGRNLANAVITVAGERCQVTAVAPDKVRVLYTPAEASAGLDVTASYAGSSSQGILVVNDNPNVFVLRYEQYTHIDQDIRAVLADTLEALNRIPERDVLLSAGETGSGITIDWFLENIPTAAYVIERDDLDADPVLYAKENVRLYEQGQYVNGAGALPWIATHEVQEFPAVYHCILGDGTEEQVEYIVMIKIIPGELGSTKNPQYLAHVTYDVDVAGDDCSAGVDNLVALENTDLEHLSLGNYNQQIVGGCTNGTVWPGDGNYIIARTMQQNAAGVCNHEDPLGSLPLSWQWVDGALIDHTQNFEVSGYTNLMGKEYACGQGNMFIINADATANGVFLTQHVYVPCSEGKMLFRFHGLNMESGITGGNTSPNIKADLYLLKEDKVNDYFTDPLTWKDGVTIDNVNLEQDATLEYDFYSGDIPTDRQWHTYSGLFDLAGEEQSGGLHFFFRLSNVNTGGAGNDFALDDIILARIPSEIEFESPCVCDSLNVASTTVTEVTFNDNPAIELNPKTLSSTMDHGYFRWMFSETGVQGTWKELQDNIFQGNTVVNLDSIGDDFEVAEENNLFGYFRTNGVESYPEFEKVGEEYAGGIPHLYIKLNADGSIPEKLQGFYKIELSSDNLFDPSCVDVGMFNVISIIPDIMLDSPDSISVCSGEKVEVSIGSNQENRAYIWEKVVDGKTYFYGEGERIVIQPKPGSENREETFRVTAVLTDVEKAHCKGGSANLNVTIKKTFLKEDIK